MPRLLIGISSYGRLSINLFTSPTFRKSAAMPETLAPGPGLLNAAQRHQYSACPATNNHFCTFAY
jgi:hypothetical protein